MKALLERLGSEIFLNPWFFLVFTLVIVAETIIPARTEQKKFTRGLIIDFTWVFINISFKVLVLALLYNFLRNFYSDYLSVLSVKVFSINTPEAIKIIFALLLGDFVFWISHYLRHKVKLFWNFHSVHHAQKELNFFSEYRVHPLDDVFIYLIHFIPILMFIDSFSTVLTIEWIRHWHTRVYHSNIKTNFGILRYVLVTPQSHRIHHAWEEKYRDKNFGLTFSLWDHLFCTQYKNYDEYPETGIDDESFPFEQNKAGVRPIFSQLIYPFRKILK